MDSIDVLSGLSAELNNGLQTENTTETPELNTDLGLSMYASAEDGLAQSIDNIFAALLIGGVDRTNVDLCREKAAVHKQAYPKFKSMYSKNIFKNEYAFFHSVLTTLKVPVFTWAQLDVIINNSADEILTSERIDLSNFATYNGVASTDEEKLEAFKYLVKSKFEELSNKFVTLDEYESACTIYNTCYNETEMVRIINDMAIIMASGLSKKVGTGRKRVWKGAADAQEYYWRSKAELDSIKEQEHLTHTRIDERWLSNELEGASSEDKQILIDTGITEIDSIHGGLHRGNIFETMGPPKGGKTTFTQYMVYRCLEKKLNVAIWPLEGTQDEWLAALTAIKVRKSGRKNITKKMILEDDFSNPVDRQLVADAKAELAMSAELGRLSFVEGVCYVEDMIDDLNDHYKSVNAFDVIVIDSPVLVLSKYSNKSKPERIGEAYTILKNYINNKLARKALALVTCQLKQTVVDEIRKNPDAEIDVTAGGESAETIRTPDYVICLVSTKEERSNNLVKIHDVAVRHAESFKPFYARAEFGCCTFYSDPGLNAI